MQQLLESSRGTAKRDIVQFVPFKDFMGKPEELAAAVLEELPNQVTSFYRMINKKPNPPAKPTRSDISKMSNINYPSL